MSRRAETTVNGSDTTPTQPWRRADLHCHSYASTEADEAVLNALACPESYSLPEDIYAQAKRRGMDFVTITDHDCIDGVLTLGRREDVFVGEEVTCYFPEDGCKMHILVWGLTREHHDALQQRARDIYKVAEYIERHNLAHAVAHVLYRQNDLLGRWHLERLILLFKGFEAVNGAHSQIHRDSLEPVLNNLTAEHIATYAARHGIAPRWPNPHVKSRTGGSDDHGLLNVGRTWTEFPPDVVTTSQALEAIRTGRCRTGGEAGSSLKLAHNFIGVGSRYWLNGFSAEAAAGSDSIVAQAIKLLIGQTRRVRKRDVVRSSFRRVVSSIKRLVVRPFRRSRPVGTARLGSLLCRSFLAQETNRAFISQALRDGTAPLGEHVPFFQLLSGVHRDAMGALLAEVARDIRQGDFAALFDGLGAFAAGQAILLPYYFALFHQNKERHLCGGITGYGRAPSDETLRVGLFTDTLDDVNGVARFLRRLADDAHLRGRHLSIATCSRNRDASVPNRTSFQPVSSIPMPGYGELTLSLPPVLEVLEWADRQQFDVIHISTPGPMGLVGLLAAQMLRVPVVATYHTDLPAFVRELTGDFRLTSAMTGYMSWFYSHAKTVFSRSRGYESILGGIGVAASKIRVLPPCTDQSNFHPRFRDNGLYDRLGVKQPLRILFVGRVSLEKNLKLLATVFERLTASRDDVALVVVGDGPYRAEMQRRLEGLPAYFLGYRSGQDLAAVYASADLFVFPSMTDTLGQVVMEAQASGLPVVVGDTGGPREVMDDGVTGQMVRGNDPIVWAEAIDTLLDDVVGRSRMGRSAAQRAGRFRRADVFDFFWEQHIRIATEATPADPWCEPTPASIPQDVPAVSSPEMAANRFSPLHETSH